MLVGNLGSLRVVHATLVPGLGGLTVNPSVQPGQQNARLTVAMERSISGRITLTAMVPTLRIDESIVHGSNGVAITAPGAVRVQASTVVGTTSAGSLEASDSIFTGRVIVARRQIGCVRHCYLPLDSVAPRRYRCQPNGAASAVRVVPRFTSLTYGQPGYAQLAPTCPVEISTGADDEQEMGAFHFLQQAQRLTSLRASLDEYLRFGLEAGAFYAT